MEHTIANRQKLMQDQARAYGCPTCAPTSPLASTPANEESGAAAPDELDGGFLLPNTLPYLKKQRDRLVDEVTRLNLKVKRLETLNGHMTEDRDYWKREVSIRSNRREW